MATANALAEAATCYDCIEPGRQQAVIIYLLDQLRLLKGGAVMTNQELADAAKCFSCIDQGKLLAIGIYLLDQVVTAGTGILCGSGPPTSTPTGCAIFYDPATSEVWIWNTASSTWDELIAN